MWDGQTHCSLRFNNFLRQSNWDVEVRSGKIAPPVPRSLDIVVLRFLVDEAQLDIEKSLLVAELITHRLPWEQTPDAYHMLYHKPDEALGVVLEWDE